jgi:RAB protein geranylgeranyltransferase component A
MSLPQSFDVIVIGTSLEETILASALSRNGKKVLLVDDDRNYGSHQHQTITLQELLTTSSSQDNNNNKKWTLIQQHQQPNEKQTDKQPTTTTTINHNNILIDLSPSLLFSTGPMIDLLVKSGVSRYLEFHTMDEALFYDNVTQTILTVPHSKSEVFASTSLEMIEKRQIMRFFQAISDDKSAGEWHNELHGLKPGRSLSRPQNKPISNLEPDPSLSFPSFLVEKLKLNPRLVNVIYNAVALYDHYPASKSSTSTEQGFDRVKQYLASIGRFGPTPFLVVKYGTGELCQAFARLCAVYGGICALGSKPLSIKYNNNDNQSVVGVEFESTEPFKDRVNGGFVQCNCVIVGSHFISKLLLKEESTTTTATATTTTTKKKKKICLRHVYITTIPILTSKSSSRAYLIIPPTTQQENNIYFIQYDGTTGLIPFGYFALHGMTLVDNNREMIDYQIQRIEQIFKQITNKIVWDNNNNCKMIWQGIFTRDVIYNENTLDNDDDYYYSTRGLYRCFESNELQLDVDIFVRNASHKFTQICGPTSEFCPLSEIELKTRHEEQVEEVMMMM